MLEVAILRSCVRRCCVHVCKDMKKWSHSVLSVDEFAFCGWPIVFLSYLCGMNEMIIKDLAVGYRHRRVASGLSARLEGGTLTALVGPNGMGKSTLLRTLAGVQAPQSGGVTLVSGGMERPLAGLTRRQLSRWIAVVLTDRVEVENITVEDVVGFGRMPYTGFFGHLGDEDRRIVGEALRMAGLEPLAHRMVDTLSDGERQKMMIAKALAQQTPVVLLDEPTAFLDYPSKVEMMRLLRSMARDLGKVIVLSTHDLNLAVRLADRLLTFGQGLEEVGKDQLAHYLEALLQEPAG